LPAGDAVWGNLSCGCEGRPGAGFTAYVEDAHGYHRSLWAFEGSLKAVGMADMLKHDIMNFIKAAS
jgi:hypothetical protein